MTFAEWNAANRRARHAYQRNPLALTDLLDREDRLQEQYNAGRINDNQLAGRLRAARQKAGAA